MNKHNILVMFLVFMFSYFILGCSGGKLLIQETYSELRPVKALELPDQMEDNLVIKISNIADQTTSYKNHVALYINDRQIEPDWLVSNVEDTYAYKMKLKPGYYKVSAVYYAYVGWGDEKFQINTHDLVKVTHDAQTILKCNIVKNPNGTPLSKKMFFDTETESLQK